MTLKMKRIRMHHRTTLTRPRVDDAFRGYTTKANLSTANKVVNQALNIRKIWKTGNPTISPSADAGAKEMAQQVSERAPSDNANANNVKIVEENGRK